LLDIWITENFNELKTICKKVSRNKYTDDLFQVCLEQFIKNKTAPTIPEKSLLYFFVGIVRNNINSTTSPYYYQYGKTKYSEWVDIEIPDEEYEDSPISFDWVLEEIEQLKKTEWYYARIFELYILEDCNLSKLSKRTLIPINSVSRDVNRVRKYLNDKRKKLLS
jgi:DNA-directed RNA polymerase specialized sigma24 family protein